MIGMAFHPTRNNVSVHGSDSLQCKCVSPNIVTPASTCPGKSLQASVPSCWASLWCHWVQDSLHSDLWCFMFPSCTVNLLLCCCSPGKGCVVPHTQMTSVGLRGCRGSCSYPVTGSELPLGLCWGCAGSTGHRQGRTPCPAVRGGTVLAGPRGERMAALTPSSHLRHPWARSLWVHFSEGGIMEGRFMSWCSEPMPYIWTWERRCRGQVMKSMMLCLGADLSRSWFPSGRRDELQRCISELCSDSTAVAQTMPHVCF